ncbi:MAG: hypothetical protein ACKPKO_48045, partial [Candidatus Fonsibacter sp.]
MLLTLQVLRHEFLQGLLHSAALQLEQVVFGGRLPDSFMESVCSTMTRNTSGRSCYARPKCKRISETTWPGVKREKYADWPWARTNIEQDVVELK